MAERLEIVVIDRGGGAGGGGGSITSAATAGGTAFRAPSVSKLALAGGVFGLGATAAIGGVRALTSIPSRALSALSTATEQAASSPQVAQARAETELGRLAGQRERDRRLGGGLANFERTRARFEERLSDLGTEILDLLLRLFQLFEPAIESLGQFIERVTRFLDEQLDDLFDGLAAAIAGILGDDNALVNTLKQVAEALREDVNAGDPDPFDNLFEELRRQSPKYWSRNELQRLGLEGP